MVIFCGFFFRKRLFAARFCQFMTIGRCLILVLCVEYFSIRKDPKLFAGSRAVIRGYGSGSESGPY
jgi:hypothetical protein